MVGIKDIIGTEHRSVGHLVNLYLRLRHGFWHVANLVQDIIVTAMSIVSHDDLNSGLRDLRPIEESNGRYVEIMTRYMAARVGKADCVHLLPWTTI